jgi:hypothetical protein
MNRPVLGSRNRCSADAGVGAGAEYTRRFVAQARAAGWECGAAQPMGEGAGELHAGGGKLDWNDLAQRDRLGADRIELYHWGGDVLIAATAADQAHLIWSREGWASFPSDFETRTWCARLPTASSARSTVSAGKQPTRAATICVDFPSDRPRHQGHVLRQQPVGGCRVQEAADQLGAGRHLSRQHAAARSHHAGASWPAFARSRRSSSPAARPSTAPHLLRSRAPRHELDRAAGHRFRRQALVTLAFWFGALFAEQIRDAAAVPRRHRHRAERSREREPGDVRGSFCTMLLVEWEFTDCEAAEIMGWSSERVADIRKVYVDHARVVVAVGERIAAKQIVNQSVGGSS